MLSNNLRLEDLTVNGIVIKFQFLLDKLVDYVSSMNCDI